MMPSLKFSCMPNKCGSRLPTLVRSLRPHVTVSVTENPCHWLRVKFVTDIMNKQEYNSITASVVNNNSINLLIYLMLKVGYEIKRVLCYCYSSLICLILIISDFTG
jgi:hypothetical protein